MFEPIYYSSLDRLVDALDTEIIKPAEVRFTELLARKAEEMMDKHQAAEAYFQRQDDRHSARQHRWRPDQAKNELLFVFSPSGACGRCGHLRRRSSP